MKQKKDILILISGFLILLLVIIGVSYAYFTANITGGEETTTIEVKGGKMIITYDGGDDINISNIIPGDNPAATKIFTVTGFNNTEVEMVYKISLVIEENNFSDKALKYKLISTNTDNNGNVITSITGLTAFPSGASTIELGKGSFEVPTDGNKTHTYDLEIYFPSADYNQNEDQEKEIKAYILTENYIPPTKLLHKVLAQGGGALAIEEKATPDFSIINSDSGLYAALDEYGTSYYYRGIKEELNNNLIWGGFQWKIVRINGDGSIRLIYNGTEAQFDSAGTVNTTGLSTQILGTHAWNATNKNDAKYVGYMYGGNNGSASSERFGTTPVSATFNQTKTNIKTVLDNWYINNILDKSFESQVVNNLFCNDRQLQSEVGGGATGSGYGDSETHYAAYHRLVINKTPTLKCGLKNDRFTTSDDATLGNGVLTYPVGLLTADEASMAGLVYGIVNSTNYLYNNQFWLSFTPNDMGLSGVASMCNITSSGLLNNHYVDYAFGVRPSVSINSLIQATGTGTASDPFVAS